MSGFDLRPVRPDDYDALAGLAISSSDTGAVRVAPRYLRNPVEANAALSPDVHWVVAEADDRLVGAAQMTVGETEVEGERYPYAYLFGLMVHPDHRRRGVAKALTSWRLDRAGPGSVVAAGIQTGNEGSFANARRWATQIFGRLTVPVFHARPNRTPSRFEIREPRSDDEWEQAAAGLGAFEHGWNLRIPHTGPSLRERASRAFDGRRLQRYFVALDDGQVVGGFELYEGSQLQTLVIEHLPLPLRALNTIVRVVPPSGELRQNSLSRVWFAPGRDDVRPVLWSFACTAAAESGNTVDTHVDLRGPLRRLFPVRPWTPKATGSIAVRSPVRLSEERLLAPP